MSGLRVLVVGGGAREHALAWALSRSPSVGSVEAAPGNAGMAAHVRLHPLAADDVGGLCALWDRERFDLVVVGPERPLSLGLADALEARGARVFGCSQAAAEIEASKGFAKALMARAGVPTAEWQAFGDAAAATEFGRRLLARDGKVVVKADGLAAGKGVEIVDATGALAETVARLLALGASVVVEEFLVGREASFMALCAGEALLPLPPCEDHKTIFDGDVGPMTGGMGAICPTGVADAALCARVEREVLSRTAAALAAEGRPFRGLLYAGLMVTASGPKVLEFNCRFGDPECEALLARVRGDLGLALLAVASGQRPELAFGEDAACTVVLAAAGYPGTVQKGAEIHGLAEAEVDGALVFHAGTRRDGARVLVDGGRVLAVTAVAADLAAARARAYAAAARIHFDGMQLRRDIGARG